jgi:hypothetical protein
VLPKQFEIDANEEHSHTYSSLSSLQAPLTSLAIKHETGNWSNLLHTHPSRENGDRRGVRDNGYTEYNGTLGHMVLMEGQPC